MLLPDTTPSTHNFPVIPYATLCFAPAEVVIVEPEIEITVCATAGRDRSVRPLSRVQARARSDSGDLGSTVTPPTNAPAGFILRLNVGQARLVRYRKRLVHQFPAQHRLTLSLSSPAATTRWPPIQ